jgi:hypothetical protein
MPQGSPKKIEVDLLLADLALELGDVAPKRGALLRGVLPGSRSRALRFRLVWSASPAKPFRAAFSILVVPLVQPPTLRADIARYRRRRLTSSHSFDGRLLHFICEISMLLRHASSSLRETVRIFSVSLLGAGTACIAPHG